MRFGRPLLLRSPWGRLGGTKRRAKNQSRPDGKRGLIQSPRRGSEIGGVIGRLARKSIVANAFFSYVSLGELSASTTNHPVTRPNDEVSVAPGRRLSQSRPFEPPDTTSDQS